MTRKHHVFVVRIWREPSARDASWRGSVYEPTSTRHVASTNLHDLWDFILDPACSAAPEGLRETQADGQKDALPARPARSTHEQDPPDDHQPRNRRRRSDD